MNQMGQVVLLNLFLRETKSYLALPRLKLDFSVIAKLVDGYWYLIRKSKSSYSAGTLP